LRPSTSRAYFPRHGSQDQRNRFCPSSTVAPIRSPEPRQLAHPLQVSSQAQEVHAPERNRRVPPARSARAAHPANGSAHQPTEAALTAASTRSADSLEFASGRNHRSTAKSSSPGLARASQTSAAVRTTRKAAPDAPWEPQKLQRLFSR
jgi:hypothetical protein